MKTVNVVIEDTLHERKDALGSDWTWRDILELGVADAENRAATGSADTSALSGNTASGDVA